ncbi:MAG: hypothetical protein GX589_04400 [Deltaproteobacteria bacterium]|nr:hypothetical protein [Deltaproteobacteria bacterium]
MLKPDTWDKRVEGIDTIVDTLGRLIRLRSDGGQEPPHKGWVLVLRDGSCESGYGWTLYGFSETKLPEVRTLE